MFFGIHPRMNLRTYCAAALVMALALCMSSVAQQKRPSSGSSRNIDAPFLKAATLLQQGNLDEAKQEVQDQLQQHPSSVDGYNLLGIISSEQKDYAAALEAFQEALKIDPTSIKSRNNLGNVYVAQGKIDLAETEFRQVLRAAPSNSDANYNLGLLLLAKHLPAEALRRLQQVHPQNTETRFNLARAYLESGKTAEGLLAANELSLNNKNDVQLHFTLGVMLASEKQSKIAESELEKANALRPDTFEILYNLGQTYLRAAHYDKAEIILNRALKIKPDSAETLNLLAQVYADQKRPVDALELLVRAHKLAPKNADVIFLMARVSMTQNYFEDAIPLLESGLEIAPQRADLRAALGESYFMSGKAEKAIDEFKKLIEQDPSARSYAFMGLSYRHLGRFDEARKYFEQGLKLDPKNASCLFNIGYIEERQGNYAKAEEFFQQSLKLNPDFSEALLELANLRTKNKKFEEAADLLKRYVRVSRDPAPGYYKLAMIERSLHQTEAAQRDLNVFQTLSKNSSTGPLPYQHLFDYLNNRSELPDRARTQLDVTELAQQIEKHPGQPEDLYLLAEAYLKLGKIDDARKSVAQLDQISGSDFRTQTGVGVLLARYHLYDDAILHFQNALHANPESDDVKFDLANAYFRKGVYQDALATAQTISATGQQDDAYLALLGDIYTHLGDSARAAQIFKDAISRNPDNDQYYLSLTLIELRGNDLKDAEQTLQKGLARIPSSGKLLWGTGIVSVMQGKTAQAAERLERAVDLLPEWAGSYSTLGIFYYQTGQIDKAREVLNRFKGSNAGGLDVSRIEEALSKAPAVSNSASAPLPMDARQQLLQMVLTIADRTL